MILEFLLCTVLQGHVDNDLGCIGVTFKPNTHIVKKVEKGSPANLIGIVPKDEITSITNDEGEPVGLEGPVGESLNLKVNRLECMYTYKPWSQCPYCRGRWCIPVVKTFVVKRESCGRY